MKYPEDARNSAALHERAKHYLPGGNARVTVYMSPFPIYAERGEGCRVWDVDGIERIDVINNFTSQIHGHSHPAIIQTVMEQLPKGTCFGLPTESEIDLAQALAERIESIDTIRFMNSGSEAVMTALKGARAYTGRSKIAKVEGAYHGSYDYAEVSLDSGPSNWGDASPVSTPYADGTPRGITDDVIVIPFNRPDEAVRIIREHGDELAAILIDPVPNRAGLIPATHEYIHAIRDAATEVGALLVMDEVISFRLGYNGAQAFWGIQADMTVLGKVIGGGFPIGALGGKRDVMAVFDPTSGKPRMPHGGTFSANPISMVAGLASVNLLDHDAYRRLDTIGDEVRRATQASFKKHGLRGQVVGMGSLLKVHFTDREVVDYRSVYPDSAAQKMQKLFVHELINRGLLTASYGLMALSTVMSDDDIDTICRGIDGALAAIKNTCS